MFGWKNWYLEDNLICWLVQLLIDRECCGCLKATKLFEKKLVVKGQKVPEHRSCELDRAQGGINSWPSHTRTTLELSSKTQGRCSNIWTPLFCINTLFQADQVSRWAWCIDWLDSYLDWNLKCTKDFNSNVNNEEQSKLKTLNEKFRIVSDFPVVFIQY